MDKVGEILQTKSNILTIKVDRPPPLKPEKEEKTKKRGGRMPRNAEGKPLKKNGEVSGHKRPPQKNIDALKLYRERRMKDKVNPPVESEVSEDEADETDEFIIEEIAIKKPEPKIIEKEVVKEVIKETPDPKVVYENQLLKQKNEKLKESFHINNYLNRLTHLSQNAMVRF